MSNDDGDLLDRADPEHELKAADQYQALMNAPKAGDEELARITVRQAQKIAAIMGAVARGHEDYLDALHAASWFLDCAYSEAMPGDHIQTSMTAAQAWERVESHPWPWPWPRPGKPHAKPL